jgi:hypothetical protein
MVSRKISITRTGDTRMHRRPIFHMCPFTSMVALRTMGLDTGIASFDLNTISAVFPVSHQIIEVNFSLAPAAREPFALRQI